jgi:hypothetical protein
MTRLIRYEYRRPGKPVQVYEEWLVLDRPDAKVLIQEYPGPDLEVDGEPMLQGGAPAVWYVFPEKWHDIARFHLRDGSLARWLDEDELEAAVRSGQVDGSTGKRIQNERSLIDLQVALSAWPPPIVRDLSLDQARALKEHQ